MLGQRSAAGSLAGVGRDWGHLFPVLPYYSEASRRTRWFWGAFEQFRATLAARLPEDDCQQVDTSALLARHPSRVRGPDERPGPGGPGQRPGAGGGLAGRFGRDAAHAGWFYGSRLAVRAGLGSRIVRAWSIVAAAVSEREAAAASSMPGRARETTFAEFTDRMELARAPQICPESLFLKGAQVL